MMLKIRGISNAENLLMGVNRFGHCLTINRRSSYLFGIGSSIFSFLPVLAASVYKIVQDC